jgi:hypothetical protein
MCKIVKVWIRMNIKIKLAYKGMIINFWWEWETPIISVYDKLNNQIKIKPDNISYVVKIMNENENFWIRNFPAIL